MSKKKDKKFYSDFIPYEKLGKKEKKKRDKEKRNGWEVPPYTKEIPTKKEKSRRRKNRDDYYYDEEDFY